MATDLQARLRTVASTARLENRTYAASVTAEAADHLDALSAHIQELEGALRPFKEINLDGMSPVEALCELIPLINAARSALGRIAG